MKKLLAISFVTVVALLAGAYVAFGAGAFDSTPSAPTDHAATAPDPTATPSAGPDEASPRCPGGSLEGCFSYSEMDDYLDVVTPLVARFFEEAYPRVRLPRDVVFVPAGRAARTPCGVSNSLAYEYCPANQTVYVGQDLLWQFYAGAGDAAPAIGLAHEFGHHLQVMLGVSPSSRAEAIDFENQADCISGAWARYAGEQGWLETEDDVRDAGRLLQAIGSAEGPGRDHGTSKEREAAFKLAYDKGIAACNAYFPDDPLA